MAIVIEANYSKKIGLPAYSSHSYSLTVRKELSDLSQVERENAKLYALLQGSVDREIQESGLIPGVNGQFASERQEEAPKEEHHNGNGDHSQDGWKCSDKQRELILKLVKDHDLDKQDVEALAQERFHASVKALNRTEASGLIQELIEKFDVSEPKRNGSQRHYRGR